MNSRHYTIGFINDDGMVQEVLMLNDNDRVLRVDPDGDDDANEEAFVSLVDETRAVFQLFTQKNLLVFQHQGNTLVEAIIGGVSDLN